MRTPSFGSRTGFTFIEILVALVIISAVAGVLLQAHIGTLRAEQMARSIDESRLVSDQAAVDAYLGALPENGVTNQGAWRIETSWAESDATAESVRWRKIAISSDANPGPARTLYLTESAAQKPLRERVSARQ